ncbi:MULTISPECIES: pseudouridine-5'-phosphate glycosidase [unclassified Caulobacter]|uniref:pseudouridine-5'-phosphate glycosidase n=1 Tax=unclassified Caulobacter TaxID=2648921 RepID=UPI0018EE558C|nr:MULTISPECIES: pseudouridine-5'-phosphate glycosidase [unclassified Caulobacter]
MPQIDPNRLAERLVLAPEVRAALAAGRPVVALESNVITHGLAYPDNVETALAVEAAVRAGGAVPATIAIEDGRLLVGLDREAIERFATEPGIPKVSSRDLPFALARGGKGATTVASSLAIAELAGIAVFASAGIGGVHRGAAQSWDVSADLVQFTRSKVAVVCAGAKTILDLGLTAEVLETQGVPLVTYGFDELPAFYCRSSGVPSPQRLDDLSTIARAIDLHWALGGTGGVLVAAPIPEAEALDGEAIETAVAEAVASAEAEGINGAGLTKRLMRAVDAATDGRASKANAAVLVHTAHLGGKLAAAYAALSAAQPRAAVQGELVR